VPISAHAEPVAGPTDGVQPLERAHAHNDYEHPINTDHLTALEEFLKSHDPAEQNS
jgi:hypothetical protein